MNFSNNEILFLNSITEGPAPFGVHAKLASRKEAAKAAAEAEDALVQKGILEKGKGLTTAGMLFVSLWENYRKCKRHIVVDNKLIGLIGDDDALVVVDTGKGFEINACKRMAIFVALLHNCEYIRGASLTDSERLVREDVSYDEFFEIYEKSGANKLVVGIFDGVLEESAFYWQDDKCYRFDINKKTEYLQTPLSMKKYLLRAFQISGKGMVNQNGR